jgi:hypothetical protein
LEKQREEVQIEQKGQQEFHEGIEDLPALQGAFPLFLFLLLLYAMFKNKPVTFFYLRCVLRRMCICLERFGIGQLMMF